jgi:hypothetical protein
MYKIKLTEGGIRSVAHSGFIKKKDVQIPHFLRVAAKKARTKIGGI